MAKRFGYCANFDEPCENATSRERIPVAPGETDATCPKCGKALHVVELPPPPPWALIAGVIALLAVIAAFVVSRLGGPTPAPPAPPIAPTGTAPTAQASPTPLPRRTNKPSPRPPSPSPKPSERPRPATALPLIVPTLQPTKPPRPHPSATPKPSPTPQPSPSATPTPPCETPNVPAHVISRVEARYPKSEIGVGQPPTVDYKLDLDEHGDITHAAIVASTGSKAFENAALDSAMRSKFAAPIVNCVPSSGTYLFHVDFYIDK